MVIKLFNKITGRKLARIRKRNKDDLPSKVEDFKEEHFKAASKINGSFVNKKYSGLMTLEVNMDKFIDILLKTNIMTTKYDLVLLTVKELKEILRSKKFKVSGNKQELINRVKNNFTEDELKNMGYYKETYTYTEHGKEVIDEGYKQLLNKEKEIFKQTIELILSNKLNEAYRAICKSNAEKPAPPGMFFDWERAYYKGLGENELKRYKDILQKNDEDSAACAIYSIMSGNSVGMVVKMYNDVFQRPIDINSDVMKEETRNITTQNASMRELQSYKECEIEKYIFTATLDDKTCPVCGELDRKVINVNDAKQGVNLPPIHSGCRCTTRAYLGPDTLKGTQRRARDPKTGRTYLVPADMSYEEWSEQYLN